MGDDAERGEHDLRATGEPTRELGQPLAPPRVPRGGPGRVALGAALPELERQLAVVAEVLQPGPHALDERAAPLLQRRHELVDGERALDTGRQRWQGVLGAERVDEAMDLGRALAEVRIDDARLGQRRLLERGEDALDLPAVGGRLRDAGPQRVGALPQPEVERPVGEQHDLVARVNRIGGRFRGELLDALEQRTEAARLPQLQPARRVRPRVARLGSRQRVQGLHGDLAESGLTGQRPHRFRVLGQIGAEHELGAVKPVERSTLDVQGHDDRDGQSREAGEMLAIVVVQRIVCDLQDDEIRAGDRVPGPALELAAVRALDAGRIDEPRPPELVRAGLARRVVRPDADPVELAGAGREHRALAGLGLAEQQDVEGPHAALAAAQLPVDGRGELAGQRLEGRALVRVDQRARAAEDDVAKLVSVGAREGDPLGFAGGGAREHVAGPGQAGELRECRRAARPHDRDDEDRGRDDGE